MTVLNIQVNASEINSSIAAHLRAIANHLEEEVYQVKDAKETTKPFELFNSPFYSVSLVDVTHL